MTHASISGSDRPSGSKPPVMPRPTVQELFDRHLRQVMRVVRHFGVPDRHVEDVTQDVWAAVHTSLPRYDASRPIEPWLFTIAMRTARAHRRRAQHREVPVLNIDNLIDQVMVADDRMSPERLAQHREALATFDAIVAGLDDDQRAVYLLHEVEEIPVPEIAVALGIPEGTAASRLQRGRARFAEGLARRRVAEQRRAGGAAMLLPIFLADPGALLGAARHLPMITTAAAARLWGRVSGVVAASAGVAAGAAGAGAAASAVVSLTRGQILAGLVSTTIAASTMTGAVMFAALGGSHAAHAPVVVAEPMRAAPGGTALAEVAADPAPSSTAIPGAPTAATGTGAAPIQDRAATERAELALLDRARGDLSRDDAPGALTVLERHRRTYPHGIYAVERDALIVRATAAAAVQDGGP